MSYRNNEIREPFFSKPAVWRAVTLAMLVAFGLATQPARANADDWVMGFHDSRHTGQTSEVVVPPLTVAWTWKDGSYYDTADPRFNASRQPAFWLPIYYKGNVCFQGGLNANRVFCRSSAHGDAVWENDNPDYANAGSYLFQFDNYPAIAAGRLIYLSSNYSASLDALTGSGYSKIYNTNGGWPGGGVASWSGAAYEQFIRMDDMSEQFSIIPNPSTFANISGSYQLPDPGYQNSDSSMRVPAVDAGLAYTNIQGVLTAWDAYTHVRLWAWGSHNFGSSPAVTNGVVYFYASSQQQLVALKASPTGTVSTLWSTPIWGALSPIVSDGVVYVGSRDQNFYAFDAATGVQKWSFPTGQPFTSFQIPAISGDLIYVPGADGILYILQKSSGVEKGRYSGTAAWGPVVIGGGMVYASDLTNTVYGFKPQTAAIGPSVTGVSLSRATNNQAIATNLTGSGFFGGGTSGAVLGIRLDNAAGTVLTGYTVASDQSITGVVVPAGVFPGLYHIKVRTAVGETVNEPVFEVAASNSSLMSTLGLSVGWNGTGTQSSYQRHLVRTSNGTLIAVYIGPTGPDWRPATYNISRDGGLTWTAQAQLLNAIIWAPSSSVWVDKQDHLNVSYLISTGGLYRPALAKFAVGTSDFLSPDPGFSLPASQDSLGEPGPVVGESGGRLWVAYVAAPSNLIALYSDNGGVSWTPTPQITAAGSTPALILYQDKPAVIYSANGSLFWAVWNGTQWSAAQVLPGAVTGVQQSPSAAVTANGQIHVAYSTASGGVSYVWYSGSAWAGPQTLDGAGSYPSLTTDGTGLWCFYTNSATNLVYQRANNGQWNSAVPVTTDGNHNISAATLTLSPDGHIPVIWTSGTSASGYIVQSAAIPAGSASAPPGAALGIGATPTGSLTQGQIGASYTVIVSNSASAGPSSGAVTVTETLPPGFTLSSMAGNGWACSGTTCSRNDVLNAGLSYPPITVTVNLGASTPTPSTNLLTVSGGNSPQASASNTAVVAKTPMLTISATHSGNFSQGQTVAVYTLTATNQAGAGPTTGALTVTATTPAGLTLLSMTGSGWGCSLTTCSRSDVLNAGVNYPPVMVTVSVGAAAPVSVTYLAKISGGGDLNTTNHTATDPTIINAIADVSGQVKVTGTGFGRNRGTGIWANTMTVTNISAVVINGPIQLVLSNLSVNATMVNNTAVRNGSPYITVSLGALAPGASVSVPLQFKNPSNGFITFTSITESGVL